VNSTVSLTAYVLSGEVEGFPIDRESGWFDSSPVLTVRMVCKPFLYGAEVTGSASSSTDPLMTVTVASVTGDVPAEGRLIVSDNATQTRRHVEWGLEQRHYNASTSLILDSDSLVVSGFSGALATTGETPVYDPNAAGTNVVTMTLVDSPVAACGTGNLSHVGAFRVKARVFASNATPEYTKVRLSWQHGDGPFQANPWVSPPVGGKWAEVDLGTISIPEKSLGTQRWTGKVEAYTDGGTSGTDTLYLDVLYFFPTGEGYGKARGAISYAPPTTFTARDEFDQSAGALSGKTLPVGGTWSGAGDADDFSVETTGKTAQRTAVSDTGVGRIGLAGTTTFTDLVAQVDVKWSANVASTQWLGLVARYVDSSNYLTAIVLPQDNTTGIAVQKNIAGAFTDLVYELPPGISPSVAQWYTVKIAADTNGNWALYFGERGAPLITPAFTGYDSVLATGGTLASGKTGILDGHTSSGASTRNFDNFQAWVPESRVVAYSGQSAEIRHDSAIREDSTGTYWGPIPEYRGSRFYLPPAGDENRTSRIAVKARRNDIDAGPDSNIADSTTVQVNFVPRYLVAPR
jgi:hypothetical protein